MLTVVSGLHVRVPKLPVGTLEVAKVKEMAVVIGTKTASGAMVNEKHIADNARFVSLNSHGDSLFGQHIIQMSLRRCFWHASA